jgi:spore coat polysaccharide biosynthesis protein SpsF (cytidylyltransferase family)
VVANSGYGDYASSSNNTIKLDANSISAISLLGKAEAISDNLADKNHNTWTILSNNQIFVHGWKDYCQFYFNGNCYSAR